MKLLDEKGIGTVWSICKEKFALVGHTHNYAGSGSPGGSANSAIGVVDYNQTGKTIQIGYSGTGITGDQINYIAGYTDGSGNVNAKIKNVSKDALKSWLGLDLFVRNVDAVTSVIFSTNVNTNDIQLNVEKADGTVVNAVVPEATEFNDGIMSKEDKVKLNGIASGANNYTLPTASDTALGGIKVSANANGSSWPICVDDNGLAETKILGLEKHGNAIKSIAFVGKINKFTRYAYNTIDIDYGSGNDKLISLPSEAGTLALTSDIPTKTSQLTNDSTFLTSADKYTLPIATMGTLGGIRASSTYSKNDALWPIIVDGSAAAHTHIDGLYRNNNGSIANITIKSNNGSIAYGPTTIQTYDTKNNLNGVLNVPKKFGTLALTDDIPDVSNLCRFNFVNNISDCESDRINFLLGFTGKVDLSPLSSCSNGTVLLMVTSDDQVSVANTSGSWSVNMEDYTRYDSSTAYKGYVYLATVRNTKIFFLKLR